MPLGCVILEGGGNADLRAFQAFGQWVNTIRKKSPKSVIPEHALCAARKNVIFIQGGDTLSEKVMEELSSAEHKSVVEESSSIVLSLLKRECVGAHCQMLSERARRLPERALQKGLECSRCATQKWLSQAMKGGAGPAHRWCGKEDAITKPPLAIRVSQGKFTADPQSVAELYAHEWKREWSGEDAIGFVKEINSLRALRENMSRKLVCGPATSIYELSMFAKLVSLSRPKRRSVSTSTRSDIALLSDNVLESLGEIIRQCFVKLAILTRSLLQLLVLLGKKNGGSRSIAILHTTYRLTMRLSISTHHSKGMSGLQVSGTLRSRVTQRSEHMLRKVVGIELAHIGGQSVIHFLWDMRKILRQHQSTSSDSAAGGKGLPARDFGFGLDDTQITEMSSSRQRIQRHHHQWLCIQHFGRLSPELLLGQRAIV